MAIFDNELIDNKSVPDPQHGPDPVLGSPKLRELNLKLDMGIEIEPEANKFGGLSIDELSDLRARGPVGFDSAFESVPKSELLENKRYGTYLRDVDLEDMYGRQQGWASQLANGTIKMAATAGATFLQGFMSLPDTISGIKNGKLMDVTGGPDGVESELDMWLKNIEDEFPNYYTNYERQHPYLAMIPGFAGSANFWGDKVIKNIGFTVGAIGSAVVQDAIVAGMTEGLGEIPLVANQVGKASLWLTKLFTGTNKLEQALQTARVAGATAEELLTVNKLGQLAAASKVNSGFRYGLNLYSSARTEAAVEARDGYRQIRDELLEQYKLTHMGEEPTGDELNTINSTAEDAANTRFGLNMAILTVSNAIQFDNLFKSFTNAGQKGITGTLTRDLQDAGKISLQEGSLDVFEKQVTKGFGNKVWGAIKPKVPNIFSEGIYEEGGQYAVEKGTYDYYTRKYKNLNNPKNKQNWDEFNEVIKSTTNGLKEQFGTTEGIENMLVGAISAIVTGGVMGKVDSMKGQGKDARLSAAINMLNQNGLTGILQDKYGDTLDSIGIAKDMQEAVRSGDLFKYKNLQHDMFFNFVNSRIPSGMHDVTIEQLKMLKDLSKEQFEKTFGMDFNTSNKNTVNEYVDGLIAKADKIHKTVESLDFTYKNPFKQIADPKTPQEVIENNNHYQFNKWKTDLAYYASVAPDVNSRTQSIGEDLTKINPLLDTDSLRKLATKEGLQDLAKSYEEKANQLSSTITENTTYEDKKAIKQQVKALRTMSEKINLAINNKDYDEQLLGELSNFELNGQDSTKDDVVAPENYAKMFDYAFDLERLNQLKTAANTIFKNLTNKEGFEKYMEQADEMQNGETPEATTTPETTVPTAAPVYEFTNKAGEKETPQMNREYELPGTRTAKVTKIADDRFQVTAPDGSVTFYPTEQKAIDAAQEMNDDFADLAKVRIVGLNPDGTVKVQDLAGNIQNIDPALLAGYEKIQTEQEKLLKDKDQIDREQNEIENNSGSVNTGDPTKETFEEEGMLKDVKVLFISGMTESEDWADPTQSAPHIKRSRKFLNNAKNFSNKSNLRAILVTPKQAAALGLNGLVQMSYGVDPSMKTEDVPGAMNVETGFVAQVFVEQVGDDVYFVDEDGNRLTKVGEQVDLNKVIFQTMPTTALTNSKGTPRYRSNQKTEAEAYAKAWAKMRAELFSAPENAFTAYKFSISRGVPNEIIVGGKRETNQVGGVLVPENIIASESVIVIPTTGNISHNGQLLKFPNGRPVIQYGDTLQFLNNRKFTSSEAKTVFEVLKRLGEETIAQSKANQPIKLNRAYTTFLQNVLFWKKGKSIKGNELNLEITDAGVILNLGGKSYDITNLAASEKEIVDQLQETFQNINNKTLKDEFSETFYEYYLDTNGDLQEREWVNYQSYLLSSKNPDGSARSEGSTPLTTSVAKPTDAIPYSFKQKYATLQGVELPVQLAPTAPPAGGGAPAAAANKIGDFTINGTTPNTIDTKSFGPVSFTATFGPDGKTIVTATLGDTMNALFNADGTPVDADASAKIKPFLDALKSINKFDATKSEKELVTSFAAMVVGAQLDAQKAKQDEEAAKQQPPAPPTPPAPEQTVEEKIKDLEDRIKTLNEFIGNTDNNAAIVASEKQIKQLEEEIARLKKSQAPAADTKADEDFDPEPPSDDYRRVGADGIERMTDAEIELFKQWAEEKVPTIPFEVLEQMVDTHDGQKAWGVFEGGVAKFVRGGLRGTEYHEVFEGIWKGLLTPQERQILLDEFRAKGGTFKDRASGKKINRADATDQQIKERIADDFADFRLGKLPATSLSQRIVNFFRRILEFFKSFVMKPSAKEEMFKAIDSGKFKDRVFDETRKNDAAEYRAVEGLTEQQTHEYIQDMTARAAGIMFGTSKKSLYDLSKLTSKDVFDKIEAKYRIEKATKEMSKRDYLGDKAWNQLVQRTKESLRTLGVNFNEEDRININSGETNSRDYAPEPFSTDWKKSSPFPVKFTLATLFQVQASNNQGNLTIKLPAISTSAVGGYKLVNFSRSFATLLDKLCNTTSVTKTVDKLIDLANYDATYVRFFQRIGGDISNSTIDFSTFEPEDWRLFIQMMQTFTKQKPEALIQYKVGNEVYTAPANLYSVVKKTQGEWMENVKGLSKKDDSVISYSSSTKTYKVNIDKIKEFDVKQPEGMVKFLGEIGINFPMEAYLKLKSEGQNNPQEQFIKAVGAIFTYLGENNDLYSVTTRTLKINGPISKLAELLVNSTNPNQDTTFFNVEGEKVNAFADNNAASVFENEFNEAETLDALLEARPELRDVFSGHSIVLKKGGPYFDKDGNRIKSNLLKVKYIQGTKLLDNNRGVTTSKLGLGDRFTQEINQNLAGNYYILVPADSSTEWMLNLGNSVSFKDFDSGRGWNKVYSTFRGYLKDDVALALDADNRKQLKNVGNKAKELRFFKDILSDKNLNEINNLIATGATQAQIEEYIDMHSSDIDAAVRTFIDNMSANTEKILKDSYQIIEAADGTFTYNGLEDEFVNKEGLKKNKLTKQDVDNLLGFLNSNYAINNIEMHKTIFGDPYQFAVKEKNGKTQLEETKRIKSFLSPRRTSFDSVEFRNHLNSKYNKAGEIALKPGDPGYHVNKPYLNTITTKDVKIVGSLVSLMKAYGDVKESDAASWLSADAYREIKLRNGQWPDEAEAFHQWQMAYTRNKLAAKGKYTYSDEALKKADAKMIEKPAPKYVIEVLKPIVSGSKYGKNKIDLVLDKFSQMPIYYSMVEGKNLENLYMKMMKEGVDYIVMESGRKVGAESLYSLYNPDGSFNEASFGETVKVPWKAYGIQVENSYEGPKEQTRGSQITKIASMDFFEDGEAVSPEAEAEYKNNVRILNMMHENAYKELLVKLGIEDVGNGFVMTDGKAVSEALMYELMRRELSDNVKDSIQLDENNQFRIPFEASPSYIQIRNILYSMVDKAIVSPKMHGGSHVQVPVTMFEEATKGRSLARKVDGKFVKISKADYNKLTEEEKKGVVLTDDTLKFYTKEDPYCEIMLPHWFKEKLSKGRFKTDEDILNYLNNTEEGRDILKGIGFRIPTQAMSSVEVFRVKGFLPQYMGKTVVVPSEITTKTGSDFDIDKLNMYLKAVYIDKNGDIKMVKYRGSEQATKDFFAQVFDEKLEKEKINKARLMEAIDILTQGLDDPDNLVERYSDILDSLLAEVEDGTDASDAVMKQLEELGDANLQEGLKEKFVKDMYKKSLENMYYESLEKLLTMPENFDRLVSPVDDAGLMEVANTLDELRGYNESNIKNRILDRNYMTGQRHAFITGKKWVGIAAVNITHHSLCQKTKVFIDPNKFSQATEYDQALLGNGNVVLPHNTIMIDGQERISLSGKTVKNGKQLISDRLSGYATSFVDVAADPYILKIIQSDLAVGTFMFLERIGAGEKTALFMSQPIIVEYLKMLDASGARGLFSKVNIETIRMKFLTTSDLIQSVGVDVSDENLKSNIREFYSEKKKFNDVKNAEQQNVLTEFLKYAKMAENNFKFSQAMNYDTTKFRSGDSLHRKQMRTVKAMNSNIISSVRDVMDSSFIGTQERILDSAMEAMGAIFRLEQEGIRGIVNKVLDQYANDEFLSQDEYDRIANKIRAALIDFIVQRDTGLNGEIKSLLVDTGTSVAGRLAAAQAAHPDIKILQDFKVDSSDRVDGAKTVTLKVNLKDAYDENLYTGYMREMRDHSKEMRNLYDDIIILSLFQGTYQSPISIKNIIPIEDYSEIVAPVIFGITDTLELEEFANGWFERNNFADDSIMPTVQPKFFLASDFPVYEQVNMFGDHYADIYQYYSSMFPNIQELSVKSTDRKILLLSEKYNMMDVSSNFVKVPRVVTDRRTGETIDMMTGETITPMDFALRKSKGDMSLRDFFGYQKVMVNGQPLLTYDKDGNRIHVYKLVNLYGDGNRASEYYNSFKPSAFDNGTIKVEEIPDADIINYYGAPVQGKDLATPQQQQKATIQAQKNDVVAKNKIETQTRSTEFNYDKAVEEANSRKPIAQNFFDGYRPNSDTSKVHTIRPEITDKYGKGVKTITLVKDGVRTRSTRLANWMRDNNPKVGDYFWQINEKNPEDKVLTRITAVYGKSDRRYKDNWFKEGWIDSDFQYVENYDSAIEFEVVKPTTEIQEEKEEQQEEGPTVDGFDDFIDGPGLGLYRNLDDIEDEEGNAVHIFEDIMGYPDFEDMDNQISNAANRFAALIENIEEIDDAMSRQDYDTASRYLKTFPRIDVPIQEMDLDQALIYRYFDKNVRNSSQEMRDTIVYVEEKLNDLKKSIQEYKNKFKTEGEITEPGTTVRYIGANDRELKTGDIGVTTDSFFEGHVNVKFKNGSELEIPLKELEKVEGKKPTSTNIEVVERYTDADVKANPNKIYVFGDNTKRTGTGGQAQIRNNPNAMGIATKIAPSMDESAFMNDFDLDKNKAVIDGDIAKIKATGKTVVFPKDGLGTGLAKLKEKAPKTYAYLKQRLLEEFGFNNDNETVTPTQSSTEVETKKETVKIGPGTSVKINTSDSSFDVELKTFQQNGDNVTLTYVNRYGVQIGYRGKVKNNEFYPTESFNPKAGWKPLSTATYIKIDLPGQPTSAEAEKTTDTGDVVIYSGYQYYGATYQIQVTPEGLGIDVRDYKGSNTNKQKLLNAYNENPDVDPQTGKTFRAFPTRSTEAPAQTIFEVRGTPLNYTFGQTKALTDLQKIIMEGKSGYYLLAGYAGTGKTTLAENIAKFAQQQKKEVAVIAPTNKAASVLSTKLSQGGVKNVASQTIHATIYGEPDPQTGEWILKKAPKNSVIIVDEASMISKEIMDDLLEATNNRNNILIFMGDSFQLEPVGEDSGLFAGKVKQIGENKTELTEVRRQSLDSDVLKLATIIRDENKSYIPSESVEDIKIAKSYTEFVNDFKESIKNNENSVMIVATNKERLALNSVAREAKFGPDRKIIENGEKMIAVANSSDVSNSETFTVTRVQGEPEKVSLTIPFGDSSTTYEVHIVDAELDNGTTVTMLHFPTLDRPSMYHQQIMKAMRGTPLYDAMDSRGMILHGKKGASLSQAVVIGTYGYSITAHKSQGSQWDKVFVYQNYVAQTWNPARWFYTAITRSAKDLVIMPSSNNYRLTPTEINDKINMVASNEPINKTVDGTHQEIRSFYNALTKEEQSKLGSLETVIGQYEEIPFTYSYNVFIESLKCKLQ